MLTEHVIRTKRGLQQHGSYFFDLWYYVGRIQQLLAIPGLDGACGFRCRRQHSYRHVSRTIFDKLEEQDSHHCRTITLEFIPQNRRQLLPLLSVFQPIGVVICTALAYNLIPKYSCSPNFSELNSLPSCLAVNAGEECCGKDGNNMGWRYLLFLIGGITIIVWICRTVLFRFRESPKFLVYRGRDDRAVEVLQQISVFNGRECTVTLEDFEKLTTEHQANTGETAVIGGGDSQLKATPMQKFKMELSRYKLLFSSGPVAWLTICVWMTYVCDYWGFSVAGKRKRHQLFLVPY